MAALPSRLNAIGHFFAGSRCAKITKEIIVYKMA